MHRNVLRGSASILFCMRIYYKQNMCKARKDSLVQVC